MEENDRFLIQDPTEEEQLEYVLKLSAREAQNAEKAKAEAEEVNFCLSDELAMRLAKVLDKAECETQSLTPKILDERIRNLSRKQLDRFSDYNALLRKSTQNLEAKCYLYVLHLDALVRKELLPEKIDAMQVIDVLEALCMTHVSMNDSDLKGEMGEWVAIFYANLIVSIENINLNIPRSHIYALYIPLCDSIVEDKSMLADFKKVLKVGIDFLNSYVPENGDDRTFFIKTL